MQILRFAKSGLIILFSIIIITGCPSAPVKQPPVVVSKRYKYSTAIAFLNNTVKTAIDKYKLDGLAVSVVDEGDIIFNKCYGYSDRKFKSFVTVNTFFRIGAVSETLTALAVVKLVRAGKIDINAPVSKYIPEFTIKSRFLTTKSITVLDLLCHHSGITANYWPGWMSDKVQKNQEILSILANEYLNFQPGSASQYTSLDYTLLGIIIERITKKNFNVYMQEEILKPLNLLNSSFITNLNVNRFLSTGYMGNQTVSNIDIRDKPSLNLFSTFSDMTEYLKFLVDNKETNSKYGIGNNDFSEMMSSNLLIDNYYGQKQDFCMGWTLDMYKYSGENIISRSGDLPGYACEIAFSPDRKIGIFVLGNSLYAGLAKYYIVSTAFKYFLEAKKGSPVIEDENLSNSLNTSATDSIQSLIGKYCSMNFLAFDVYQKNGGLYGSLFGQEFILRHGIGNEFFPIVNLFGEIDPAGFIEAKKIYLEFYTNSLGNNFIEGTLIFGNLPLKVIMEKSEKSDIPAEYSNYTGNWIVQEGKYKLPDLIFPKNMTINFSIEDGWVKLKLFGRDIALLKPVDDNSAVIWGTGDTVSLNKDNMTLLGMRFKRK